jgi:uncharacterized oxidoreductase
MNSLPLDIEDAANITAFAQQLTTRFPSLNLVIHNAGIMRPENLLAGSADLTDAEAIIATNLLGPIRLNTALLPHLTAQPHATIITVSSGLAFVPLAITPTYNATKAAIHAYTEALRYQLRKSSIQIIEIIPPYVATELLSAQGVNDPRAMPLPDFITEVIGLLQSQPNATEICVERVKPLRFAAESGHYDAVFTGLNEAFETSQ